MLPIRPREWFAGGQIAECWNLPALLHAIAS
jgi:hypothetical protein